MTYAPFSLMNLRAYLMPKTGLSASQIGIVGDAAHAKHASYHNGKDRIRRYGRTRTTDYSIKPDRDWAGLTDAAMGLDIGNHPDLRHLSIWLVDRARTNHPGTRDMREIIYTADGHTVLRWDRERGATSQPKPNEADDSHLVHTHIGFYRDSEKRDKISIFRPYYEGDEMDLYSGGQMLRRLPAGADLYDEPGGTKTGDLSEAQATKTVFRVVATDKSQDWWLIDGGGSLGIMRWVKAI